MWAVPYAALLVFAGGPDVFGTVVSEMRAGEMPFQLNEPSQLFVAALVIPFAEVQLRQPDLTAGIGYGVRLFWQDPATQGTTARPLVLQMAHAGVRARPSARVTLSLQLSGSAGEVDYSLLPQVFGSTQSALPVGAAKILTGTGTGQLGVSVSRRWRLALGARIEYRQPLGEAGTAAALTFPPQTVVAAEPAATFRLTAQHDLTFATSIFYGDFSDGIEILTVSPRVGWRFRMRPLSVMELWIGIAGGRDLGPIATVGSAVWPVGGARLEMAGLRVDDVALRFVTGFSADYVVDPVLRVAGPRGTLSAGVVLGHVTTWTVGAEALLATSLLATPLPGEPDETTVSVSFPIRHPLSEYLVMEFGGRLTERAPSFAAQQFGLHQQQIWLYFMLVGTTRGTRATASP